MTLYDAVCMCLRPRRWHKPNQDGVGVGEQWGFPDSVCPVFKANGSYEPIPEPEDTGAHDLLRRVLERMPETHACAEQVIPLGTERMLTTSACTRNGTRERYGKWWCWQHDPEAVRERRAESDRKYDEQRAKDDAHWRRKAAEHHACEGISTETLESGIVKRAIEQYDKLLDPIGSEHRLISEGTTS